MPRWHQRPWASITSRATAAIVGGYVLAALSVGLFSLLLPMPRVEAVLTSMLSSFLIYALTILWVFSTRTATRAWVGVSLPSALLALALWVVLPGTVA